jgi:AraC family transcriptional regulator, regulatory protein of adaptative response / methylated-DNA-[protein]-cysteine methyltransferase
MPGNASGRRRPPRARSGLPAGEDFAIVEANPNGESAVSAADDGRVERAIGYLVENAECQPDLEEVARHVGLSEFHFQRLFRRRVGVSPKRFLQYLTAEHAKQLLRESLSTLEVSFGVGLSSTSRLHDLMVSVEAVTPGEMKRRGAGLEIRAGVHPTAFGACLLGITDRGICHLSFHEQGDRVDPRPVLAGDWPGAAIVIDAAATEAFARSIFSHGTGPVPLPLLLRGTNFQLKVWQALLRIPVGNVSTYGALAEQIGLPGGARAVGGAVGDNHVAVLVPCHRVIRATGVLGGYRWGGERKRALLAWESARASEARTPGRRVL